MTAEAPHKEGMRTRVQDRADTREGRADFGVVGDIHYVTGQRQAEPDAEAGAMDRGKAGRRKVSHTPDHRVDHLFENSLAVLIERVSIRQVTTGGKAWSLTAQDKGTHSGVLSSVEPLGERLHRGFVQSVHLCRPVQHDLSNRVLDDKFNAHDSSSSLWQNAFIADFLARTDDLSSKILLAK